LAKTYPGCPQNLFGCTIFFYAILVALAAALSLFGIARIANAGAALEPDLGAQGLTIRGGVALASNKAFGS
jgi:hypothetical protein